MELPFEFSVYAAFTFTALVFRSCAFCTFAPAALSRNLRDRRTLVGGCFGIDIRRNIGNLCRFRGCGDCGGVLRTLRDFYILPQYFLSLSILYFLVCKLQNPPSLTVFFPFIAVVIGKIQKVSEFFINF
ncbi:MAG: hypothetical protein OSJ43_09945 [Oscillospiraceae bacterium]|nr:hypothetical protein [Oscillospiraceae bacterium]